MLPWSRSSTSTPPIIPSTSDSNQPTFLANHHRTSTSSINKSVINNKSNNKGKSIAEVNGVITDEEDWSDGSDDENKRNKLAALTLNQRIPTSISSSSSNNNNNKSASSLVVEATSSSSNHSVGINSENNSSTNLKTTTTTTINTSTSNNNLSSLATSTINPITPTSSSAWSFNPFSLISPKSPSTPTPPPTTTNSNSSITSNEINSTTSDSNSKGKKVAIEQEDEQEILQPIMERRGSHYRADQLREAIKPNVEDLVKDPLSLLTRLEFSTLPPPSTSTSTQPTAKRPSISSPSPIPKEKSRFTSLSNTQADDTDSDEDEISQGYLPLGALNISSTGPEIVEFGAEEEKEEDMGEKGREKRRRQRFIDCLGMENVDLAELRKLSWAGIPGDLRPIVWQLLLGYLPAPSSRRLPTLARKRQEYADAVRLAFSRGIKSLDGPIWHQISIDVPRTNAGIRLWQAEATQRSLEKILYVWAIRHPASGYVQGINDLVTPFFQVFLSSYITMEPEQYDVGALPPSVLEALEADSFWCLSKLLDGIQDNYIFAQPGIQRQVARMKELCSRVDAPLAHHLEENSVEFIQFAFRWMNCLLMRELSVKNIIRMWDTYLAEGADAFSEFHLYVCLAFLVKWSEQLRGMDFQAIIMFLQSLPTQNWSDQNTELLLSEAFMWSRTFEAR